MSQAGTFGTGGGAGGDISIVTDSGTATSIGGFINLLTSGASVDSAGSGDTVTITVTGGGGGDLSFVTDSGTATSVASSIGIIGGTGISTSGSGANVTFNLETPVTVANGGTGASTLTGVLTGNGASAITASTVTQYGTVIAGVSNAVSSVAPHATSGVPYISQGAASNPAFGTAVVAGGGTGNTTFTAYSVVCAGTTATGVFQNVSGVGTAAQVLTSNGAGNLPTWQAAGSATVPNYKVYNRSLDFQANETNFAPLELLSGTTIKQMVRAFDQTTEEFVNGVFRVPSDLTTGTVTFTAYVMAKTAAASKNIGLTFAHAARNNSEDFDPASPYTDLDSGAIAIDATQDALTLCSFTQTVTNLAWAANDIVFFKLSRDVAVANNLAADMYLFDFNISIPRA